MGSDSLDSLCFEGSILDDVLVILQLHSEVDGTMLLKDGILVHDHDDGTSLGLCKCSSGTHDYGIHLVIGNAGNIHDLA